jgi:two-component system cell cycle sensor histidine kinase/response regulator CckA
MSGNTLPGTTVTPTNCESNVEGHQLTATLPEINWTENRFRLLIQNVSDIITVLSVDGIILYQSPALQRILGHIPEDLIGKSVFDYLHSEDLPGVIAAFSEALASPNLTVSPKFRFRHANGSWVYLEAIGNNLVADPQINGIVVISRDVSEQRALEEQLRQAQKMEAIGQLAGGIAHDFNNLLMVIRGFAELNLLDGAQKETMRQNSQIILKTTLRGASLTQRLLLFGRKQIMTRRAVDLNAVIAEFTKMLPQLLGIDVELSLDLKPDLAWIRADSAQLEQVVMNLALNARDAMPRGGKLKLTTSHSTVAAPIISYDTIIPPGNYVTLQVTDTGTGMEESVIAHAFEPFYTTKEKSKGSGLGLSIVYGIVRQSRGFVSIHSELGKGTAFSIYFPPAQETGETKEPVESVATTMSEAETVLVAEDEADLRDVLGNFLKSMGYTVLNAGDGLEALEVAKRYDGPIDLLLTDVMMPGMKGPELAARLKSFMPEASVIYMSGFADSHLRVRDLPGNTPFLQKPFGLDELRRIVLGSLAARRAVNH